MVMFVYFGQGRFYVNEVVLAVKKCILLLEISVKSLITPLCIYGFTFVNLYNFLYCSDE